MLFNQVINLVLETHTSNDVGDTVTTQVRRKVFADKQSVRQSEYYQAGATGIRPEFMFVVRAIDYKGEPKVEHEGKQYTIVRTFEKPSELTELVCQGVVNNG